MNTKAPPKVLIPARPIYCYGQSSAQSPLLFSMLVSLLLALTSLLSSGQAPDPERLRQLMTPLSPAQVRQTLPEGIERVPDFPYREGHELWKLDLAMPAAHVETPRPAVVIVHSGGWRRGDKRANIWARYAVEYAKRGFVAISVNYRLVPDNPFPAAIEDVKTAVRWLRAHASDYNVDVNRIGVYGNSAGAHLVLVLGLSGPDPILEGDEPWRDYPSNMHAVVASASPTDIYNWTSPSGSTASLFGNNTDNLESLSRFASPLFHVSSDAPPILLIHGTDDQTVPYDQSKRLMQALIEAGAVDVAFKSYTGDGHTAFTQNLSETLPMTLDFFERTLAS